MCLRSDSTPLRSLRRACGALAAAILAAGAGAHASAAAAAPRAPDEVLDYLEARGLDSLAALKLEALAEGATGEVRNGYLERLADLYARLLEAQAGGDGEARLLARADRLAGEIAVAKGDLLRVAAAQARYREAAGVAERIRAGAPVDPGKAIALLAEQERVLLGAAERADKRSAEADAILDRAEGLARDLAASRVDRERGLAARARFLAAWSLLYHGLLAREQESFAAAEVLFANMLGAREGRLAPADVSEDLRADDAYASAILGLALAKARTAGYSEAQRWLVLLDHETTAPAIRDSAPGWRMVAALDARAFVPAREAFAALASREDAANWARVAVARAVEDGGSEREAVLLRTEALAQLAARRDLASVRELVERFGEGVLGEDRAGFVPRYVRAVRLYEESQQAVGAAGDDPERLVSEEVRAPARAAAEALAAALAAADAGDFADAATSCRLMHGWSLRAAGDFTAAAAAFDEVAAAGVGARAEDAARLAVLSIDDARRLERDAAARERLDADLVARVDAFLSRFPASERVPEMLVRKVAASAAPSATDVDRLLEVKPGTPEWLTSRRQAVLALYRAFRGEKGDRRATGRRYLEVLAELPADEATGLPAGSSAIARQALEVALATEMRELALATSLLDALAKAAELGQFDIREADEELAYRRLQIAIAADRWADVEAAIAPFEKPEATDLWADAALRLALRGAESRRRGSDDDDPARGGFVATILRAGDAILARGGGVDAVLAGDDATLLQVARIALDARIDLLRASADPEEAARALVLARGLLAKAPRDAALLRAAALAAETAGELEEAADSLRALVGGLPPRTNPWFEAKVDQLRVLARLDPARAAAVYAQFRALYPELGPEPYRTRFLEIARGLGEVGAAPEAPGGGG